MAFETRKQSMAWVEMHYKYHSRDTQDKMAAGVFGRATNYGWYSPGFCAHSRFANYFLFILTVLSKTYRRFLPWVSLINYWNGMRAKKDLWPRLSRAFSLTVYRWSFSCLDSKEPLPRAPRGGGDDGVGGCRCGCGGGGGDDGGGVGGCRCGSGCGVVVVYLPPFCSLKALWSPF